MFVVIEVYCLLLFFSIKSFFERTNLTFNQLNKLLYAILVCILILFVGLRDKLLFADYANYEWLYNSEIYIFEPTFKWLSLISKKILHGSIRTLMLIYAFIAIMLKWKAINEYSSYPALSFAVLISDLFLLQDCTQIRASVAVGFLLFSIKYIYNKIFYRFTACVIMATLFHVSSIFMIPLYFLNTKLKYTKFWLCFIIFGYILAILHFNPVTFAASFTRGYLGHKIASYADNTETANVFSIYSLSKLIVLLFLLIKINVIKKTNKYAVLLVKIQSLSIFALCFFSQNLAAALRISEFYSIVDILLFPLLVSTIKEKTIGRIIVILFAVFWLTMRVFRYRLIAF